jgi:hypothetical protein
VSTLALAGPNGSWSLNGGIIRGDTVTARADAAPLAPVTLQSGTILVRPVNLLSDGSARFFLRSTPDTRYQVEATTDFDAWVPISTNLATGIFMDLIDPGASNDSHRFYRNRPVP